jgi:anaerobic selenocysteine-containing dehydrogenase
MNDSYANDLQVRRALGAPRVTVHPEDARALGLVDGEPVRLSNETGEIVLRVSVSDVVAPGVALAHKGHWPKLEDAGVNVNALNPGVRSDMGQSTSVHGTLVQIAPA